MPNIRKASYTLVEMLVVLMILVLVIGSVTINVRSAIKEQRYRTEVAVVVDQLRLAQDLMLVMGADIIFKFDTDSKGKGIKYWLETKSPLPKGWTREVTRPHKNLQEIHMMTFTLENAKRASKEANEIVFSSGCSIMSNGLLRLSTSSTMNDENAMTSLICLPGYPAPIEDVDSGEVSVKGICDQKKDVAFDDRLTLFTKNEIGERLAKSQKNEKKK